MGLTWRGRRVLVTGASGIVGSWLVKRLLSAGAQVGALLADQDPRSELFRSGDAARLAAFFGSLEDSRSVSRAVAALEPEVVFHLGAQTLVEPALRAPVPTFDANIRGTYHLLEACRSLPGLKALVVASSDKAYGEGGARPYVESMALEGLNPYDASKACADLLGRTYARSYGLPVVVSRCGNIYGGGDLNWSRLVPGTIRSLLRGERPVLRSDGRFVRDYLYVKDAASAYLRLAERAADPKVRGRAFNFSAESPRTVLQVVAAIQHILGTNLRPLIENRAVGEIRQQRLSSALARRELRWRAEYPLEEGLRETVAWYRAALS